MKKLAIILAGMLAASTAFAMPALNSDVQVHTGIGFDTIEISDAGVTKTDSVLFNLDIQSWNLFELNDLFSVGFMVGTDFGWGGITNCNVASSSDYQDAFHWNIIAAPAVAFSFKPVKIQCSIGFDFAIAPGGAIDNNYVCFPLAFGLVSEVQAKFFPNERFSPIVGFRWGVTGSGRAKDIDRDTNDEFKYDIDNGLYSFSVLYVGASFNF